MNENIWALSKDVALKHLLLMLMDAFGADKIDIHDRRDADPRAITLCKPGESEIQAYIYLHGQDQGKFGVHLEFPELDDINMSDTEIIRENVSWERLAEMLAVHFDIVAPATGASPARSR